MDRRSFLIRTLRGGSVLLVLPAGWAASGCGGGSTGAPVTPTSGPPVDGVRFTSDTMGGHTHDFVVAMADFAQPPANGVSGDTTVTLGHSHTVTLTMAELATIEAGLAVSKATSVVTGHKHTFKFELSTALPDAGAPADDASTG